MAGLLEKFRVSRLDGRDLPGNDKENARYFVLDYANDKFAKKALMYYAKLCQKECPELSQDLWIELKESYNEEV